MARRRKDSDIARAISGLIGLAFILVAMPGHKSIAEALQWFTFWIIGIGLVGLLIFAGFMGFKASNAHGTAVDINSSVVAPRPTSRPVPVSLSESLRKIDWF